MLTADGGDDDDHGKQDDTDDDYPCGGKNYINNKHVGNNDTGCMAADMRPQHDLKCDTKVILTNMPITTIKMPNRHVRFRSRSLLSTFCFAHVRFRPRSFRSRSR